MSLWISSETKACCQSSQCRKTWDWSRTIFPPQIPMCCGWECALSSDVILSLSPTAAHSRSHRAKSPWLPAGYWFRRGSLRQQGTEGPLDSCWDTGWLILRKLKPELRNSLWCFWKWSIVPQGITYPAHAALPQWLAVVQPSCVEVFWKAKRIAYRTQWPLFWLHPLHAICRPLAEKACGGTSTCSKHCDPLKMPIKQISRAALPTWISSLNQENLTERDAEIFHVVLGKLVPLGTCYCRMAFAL